MKLTTLLPTLLLSTTTALTAPGGFEIHLPSLPALKSHLPILHLPRFLTYLHDPISTSPLLSLHRSLIEIPSLSGSEYNVAQYLLEYLTTHNFTVETHDVPGFNGDRQNIYAYLSSNRTTHTLLTSHIDTVPPFIPYKASLNTIYGRGSNDAKGSVAAQIIAVEELVADGLLDPGHVGLLFVVGEEITGDGMRAVNPLKLNWNSVIFGEPTENKLAVGHKGIIKFNVRAKGKASHSGYPHLGINANSNLIQALAVIDRLELPGSEELGDSTINIGLFQGGVAVNVISASAEARGMIRVAGDYDETVKILRESVADLPVELEIENVGYGPVSLSHDVPEFETIICSYGTDVPHLNGNHKSYLYGPGS